MTLNLVAFTLHIAHDGIVSICGDCSLPITPLESVALLCKDLFCAANIKENSSLRDGSLNSLDMGIDQDIQFAGRQSRMTHNYSSSVIPVRTPGGDRLDFEVLNDTPTSFLKRQYPIPSSGNFTPLVTGTVNQIWPWKEMLSQEIIQSGIETWRYIRADIRIRFDFNTTVTDVGCVVISWVPDCASTFSAREFMNADPIIVDLSTMRSVELVVPWTSLADWIDRLDGNIDRMVQVEVRHLYVANINGATAPSYRMFAAFENPQVAGSFPAFAVAQSGEPISGPNPYMEIPANIGDVPVATSAPYLMAAAVTAAPTVVKTLSSMWNTADQFHAWYRGGDKFEKKVVAVKSKEEPGPVRQYTYGNLAGASYCPSLQLNSHFSDVVPPYHLGDAEFRHRIQDIMHIPTIRHWFEVTGIHVVKFKPFAQTDVPVTHMEMIMAMFRHWRGSIRVRLLFHSSPLEAYQVTVMWANGDQTGGGSAVALKSSYQDIINVRGFTVRDYLVPYLYPSPWVTRDQTADTALKVWGQLVVNLTQSAHTFGSASSKIFCVAIVSAGPDFQVKDLQSVTSSNTAAIWEPSTPAPFAEAQMHVRSSWNTEFSNLAGGQQPTKLRDLQEDYLTLEDISMRFSSRSSIMPLRLQTTNTSKLWLYDNFDYIQMMFRYVRGSVRYKVSCDMPSVPEKFPKAAMSGFYNQTVTTSEPCYRMPLGNGVAMQNVAQNGVLEFEIPFYSNYDWALNDRIASGLSVTPYIYPIDRDFGDLSAQYDYYMVAAGLDYQLAWLLPPYKLLTSIPGMVPIPPTP